MTDRPELPVDTFAAFFRSFNNGRDPFRWQVRLAEQACAGIWPDYIKLPTASGKTSCLDIAVFALAFQACRRDRTQEAIEAPRRIFFVVDRRIIVSEAFERASKIARFLQRALDPEAELRPDEQDSFEQIAESDRAALANVAGWLRHLAGNEKAPPLDCYELRGGIYRDDAWVRSLLQPTIVTSTVDQVGSRLLFRGYGVSDRNLAIHAALTANDALILLDEAHCSNPFSQTMKAIARYRDAGLKDGEQPRWAEQSLKTPFKFVEMTATPPHDAKPEAVLRLDDADYAADSVLNDRHGCAKLIRLEASSAKGAAQNTTLAKHLVEHAESLAKGSDQQEPCRRIAIVVNRVACARAVYALLRDEKKGHGDRVELMIGRMRPLDRDGLTKTLQQRFKSGSEEKLSEPHFVVATQCLEVGADFDFDGMVTQCASLDALRQRFGRLNRLGQSKDARGVIVMAEGDKAPRKPDPIYGESLPATWEWLQQQTTDGEVNFGIKTLDRVLSDASRESSDAIKQLSPKAVDAPVLMPAHLDLLCQTAPRPALEPNIAAYLHGPNRGVPEVRICWRADLPELNGNQWEEACQQTLALCPPSSAECLSVPLSQFKAWLKGEESDDFSDLLGEQLEDADDDGDFGAKRQPDSSDQVAHRRGVIWKGQKCVPLNGTKAGLKELFPNAVIVLPATAGGWDVLGHVPNAPAAPDQSGKGKQAVISVTERRYELARIDIASAAFKQSRNRDILRVHRSLMTSSADTASLNGLWKFIPPDTTHSWKHSALSQYEEEDDASDESGSALTEAAMAEDELRSSTLGLTRELLAGKSAKQVTMVRYPQPIDGVDQRRGFGIVIVGPLHTERTSLPRASFDDDFDEHNLDANERLSLADHLADVADETERLVENINLEAPLADALIAAAERHDLGKADLRFQAMLLGSSLDLAAMQPTLWAKSSRGAESRRVTVDRSSTTHEADQLPRGFRHEMLSLQLAELVRDDLDNSAREVMLHAIAAHHGHARPFAPVVEDAEPLQIHLSNLFPSESNGLNVTLSASERAKWQAHRLDSGISERFWKLNRRFGWWGLAWLESALRLADWVASAHPKERPHRVLHQGQAKRAEPATARALACVGLNGANPLGFLAAVGLFRHVTEMLEPTIRMKWQIAGGNWSPVFIGAHEALSTEATFLDWLFESLKVEPNSHWLKRLNEIPDDRLGLGTESVYSSIIETVTHRDRLQADWLSCNGSDLCEASSNNQLQTARRDYFPESAAAIVSGLTREHLERTMFRIWDYADPIQKVSLHLEPREDRRHAYQWFRPVGDPTRTLRGGMLGANRLAMEAWPLFQSVAVRGDLQTVGFLGTRPMKGIRWTWPLWSSPLSICDATPILNLADLQYDDSTDDSIERRLLLRGIATAFRLKRILVEKTPNFTSPVALFTRSNSLRESRSMNSPCEKLR